MAKLATNLTVAKVEIDSLGGEILTPAFNAADAIADGSHRTRGGYVALGAVQGSDTYKIAIRPVKTERGFQFACGCKHWIFKCNKAGTLCKHQKAFLANPEDHFVTAPGQAFCASIEQSITGTVAEAKVA